MMMIMIVVVVVTAWVLPLVTADVALGGGGRDGFTAGR